MHIDLALPASSERSSLAIAINTSGSSSRDAPLSMPRPPTSTTDDVSASSATFSTAIRPMTPMHDETPPTTPLFTHPPGGNGSFFGGAAVGRRPSLLRRNSSVSSVASSVGDDEEEDEVEWTTEEQDKIRNALENYIESVEHAPFSSAGPPPSNLPSLVARTVIHANNRELRARAQQQSRANACAEEQAMKYDDDTTSDSTQKWRHGIRSTRKKVLAIVKEKQQMSLESTPRQEMEETPKRRKPLARQGSMDFLPTSRNVGIVARLGSKLHRAEQTGPPLSASAIHSYASRPRAFRTTSLSSIAGSPTQPTPAPARPMTYGSPVKSARMQRIGSDSTGQHHAEFAHLPSPGGPSTGMLWSEPSSTTSSSIFNFSFGGHSSSSTTPKRTNTGNELGSAFLTPGLSAAYPSPVSQKKAKHHHSSHHHSSHHHSSTDEAPIIALSSPFGSSFPADVQGLGVAFGARPDSALPVIRPSGSPVKRRTGGGRLGMSESWAEHLSSSSSSGSISDWSIDSQRLHPSSSFSSLESNHRDGSRSTSPFANSATPSPLSSTFDLNDLSLDALDEERHKAVLPKDYLQAGEDEQQMRDKLRRWGGWTAQALGPRE